MRTSSRQVTHTRSDKYLKSISITYLNPAIELSLSNREIPREMCRREPPRTLGDMGKLKTPLPAFPEKTHSSERDGHTSQTAKDDYVIFVVSTTEACKSWVILAPLYTWTVPTDH